MNFKPVFELGLFRQERTGQEDKLGGLPFGFPAQRWPVCAVCGRSQNFIGQFRNTDTVDLRAQGRVLFLFQCPDGALCGAWDQSTGANCAMLVDAADLTGAAAKPPSGCEVEPEAIIAGWESVEPSAFISYAGGSPSYDSNHDQDCEVQGRFLLQLVGSLDFKDAPPSPADTGAEHLHYWGGRFGQDHFRVEQPPRPRQHYGAWSRGQSDHPGRPSQIVIRENGQWSIEWANFGGGTAYVFIDDEADVAFYFSET